MFGSAAQLYDDHAPEFKAIVLTMSDSDMYPLTEPENMPKALLPIANKPMLWYVLQWLEQGGILDIKIVTTREWEVEISNYVDVYKGIANITVKELDDVTESADALRLLAPQIKSDVIVVPCDLIVDVPATHFLDMFRLRRPAISTLFYEMMKSEGGGGSSKARMDMPCVGIDQPSSRLVLVQDIEKKQATTSLPMSLIRRFPSMVLSNKMCDSHVYVLKRWVLDYIVANPDISSIQDDLLPLFVQAQSQPSLLESNGISQYLPSHPARLVDESDTSAQFGMPDGAGLGELDNNDPLKVFAYIRRNGIAGRADQVPLYCDLNCTVARITVGPRVDERAVLAQQTQVGADSMVGPSSQLGDRCSIKRSVVGAHCIIGKNVKIINSVIMDHVTIGDGVRLESCVVCKLAKISDNAQLKDCEVGAKSLVVKGAKRSGITITAHADDDEDATEFV
ncbi:Translation initiation factor eIF-2B subunit gamma [Coemansia sp. RSA 2050]|nr:Translation initiation factor eIF-2B subunit gamma [Coemansia sp. RSA 2050]KAJ2734683.1 Translation initiation factor eIF-2B subunit gamma [Coemansia sp. BCRC 34962]